MSSWDCLHLRRRRRQESTTAHSAMIASRAGGKHESAMTVPRGCRLGSRVVKGSGDVAYEVVAYEIAWPLLNKGVTRVPIRADLVTNHLSQRDASN